MIKYCAALGKKNNDNRKCIKNKLFKNWNGNKMLPSALRAKHIHGSGQINVIL